MPDPPQQHRADRRRERRACRLSKRRQRGDRAERDDKCTCGDRRPDLNAVCQERGEGNPVGGPDRAEIAAPDVGGRLPSLPAMKYARNTVVSCTKNADVSTAYRRRSSLCDQTDRPEVRKCERASMLTSHSR